MKKFKILLSGFLVALVIAGATLGVCLGTKKNVKENTSPLVISTIDSENTGVFLSVGEAVASADGTTSQTLTATVSPAESATLPFNWTVGFKNPSSAWASGKNVTDYVTVTKDSSNQLKATVKCIKAFSEQIIVSIGSDYSNASASCTVDYIKRVQSVTLTFTCSEAPTASFTLGADEAFGNQHSYNFLGSDVDHGPVYTLSYNVTLSDGTIQKELYVSVPGQSKLTSGQQFGFDRDVFDHENLNSGDSIDVKLFYGDSAYMIWEVPVIVAINTLALDKTSITF